MCECRNVVYRLKRADFVVSCVNGDHEGVIIQGLLKVAQVYKSVFIYWQDDDLETPFNKSLARSEDGFVFDSAGDNFPARGRRVVCCTQYGNVITLGRAGGKKTSPGCAPIRAATCSRAVPMA